MTTRKAPGTVNRVNGIGGSDVGVLCGLSGYKTAYELYLEKRSELPLDESDAERQRFGRRLEKPIADEFAYRTGRKTWRQRRTLRHPEYKFLLANIDRFQERDGVRGVYEGKNSDWRMRSLWIQGGVPDTYYLQLQHYLLVTGDRFGSFGVLFGGNELHYFDIERDDATIAQILALELDFWDRVKTGNPPDYTFGEAGAKLVKRMYGTAKKNKQTLLEGPEAEAKIKRLLSLRAAVKSRETEILDLETWLKLKMGDCEFATFIGLAKIAWKNSARNHVDLDRLRRDHTGLVSQYTEERMSRRFTISAIDSTLIEEDITPDKPIMVTTGVRVIDWGD